MTLQIRNVTSFGIFDTKKEFSENFSSVTSSSFAKRRANRYFQKGRPFQVDRNVIFLRFHNGVRFALSTVHLERYFIEILI